MDKKKLMINAAVCDARNVSESTLEAYEKIVINAALICVSDETKELMSRYNVNMNSSEIIEVPAGAEIMVENGTYEISVNTVMTKPTVLIVNGSLEIERGSQQALEKFLSIIVNGCASYPSEMKEQLSSLKINGTTECYPGDAIRLKSSLVMDKTFIIRAKEARYYVKDKIVIADGSLDVSALVEKGTTFKTNQVIIADNLLEKALTLFDEEVDIKIIPEGFTYVCGAVLNDALIQKNGDKLFIDGDLTINIQSENALNKLTCVKVNGTVLIVEKLMDRFQKLNLEYDKIKIIKGKILEDKIDINIDKRMIIKHEDGITVSDCAMVHLHEDITPDEIEEKLEFIDCGCIFCYPEQRCSVELVSQDVGRIEDSGKKGLSIIKEMLEDLHLFDKDTKVVNASNYKM